MEYSIYAICFDVGGTLRITPKKHTYRLPAMHQLRKLLGWSRPAEELAEILHLREKQYRKFCLKTLCELSEEDLWSKFLLPDYPADFVIPNAKKLNQLWHGRRDQALPPDTVDTIRTLAGRGYRLAIISNTTSSTETPQMLAKNGLTDLFSCVILSTTFGRRKPHPSLFISAARQMGVSPENCAYVGNDSTRDLVGARQAGYGQVILRESNGNQIDDPDDESRGETKLIIRPDLCIDTLGELLDVFPKIPDQPASLHTEEVLYDAALSTMWGIDQPMPFNQTFIEAKKIGFARFELNHKVSSALYQQYDHDRFYIATVHEPCPTEMTYEGRKSADIVISSLDEKCRTRSVDDIKTSIELATRLGSRSVVIHPGGIVCDKSRDYRLRELFQAGLRHTPAYQTLLDETIADRKKYVQAHFDRVLRSMEEIICFARGSGIAIGLENRYRYYDIPLPDEMAILLDLCKKDWFGFQYDVGHAHTLDVLGLADHFEWLERFSERMIGVHLHDVCGITDHQVPGKGDVNFTRIAPYIPAHVQCTLEIGPRASLNEMAEGLKLLAESGCIQKI
jgi:HAD superfamily hydrolase (TIGR01549 family)